MTSHNYSPSVAVIGGGIAGLVCAARLGQLNIKNVTVFDTGKHTAGGRCSSRKVNINGQIYVFDHSAQYFTVSDSRFAKIVSFLHKNGAVQIWRGNIGHLKKGHFEKDTSLTQAFIGTDGMQTIPTCLSSIVDIKRSRWVADVTWEHSMKKWKVDKYGYYDYLVIAHNGKCADKLMSNAGVPAIHKLLQVRFSDRLNPYDPRMHLCTLWALLVAFPQSLNLSFEGAHVTDADISWVANNTSKTSSTVLSKSKSLECWTIFSTKEFGSANKVPQENISPHKAKDVTNKLLTGFARVTGLENKLPDPCFTRVQLWGAALPLNVMSSSDECVFDGQYRVGICGDWLVSPCIQGAAVSGLALAEKIHQHHSNGNIRDEVTTSLEPIFKPSSATPIGAFPVDRTMIFTPKQ